MVNFRLDIWGMQAKAASPQQQLICSSPIQPVSSTLPTRLLQREWASAPLANNDYRLLSGIQPVLAIPTTLTTDNEPWIQE